MSKKKKPTVSPAAGPAAERRLLLVCVALLVALALPDLFLHKHTYFYSYEALPGFFALLGLLAIGVLAGVALLIGALLRRGEDYYG